MGEQQTDNTVASQQPAEPQQSADDELAFPDLKPGDAWGESITKQQADVLEAILQAWEAEKEHEERRWPFAIYQSVWNGVKLTGADVFWLATRTDKSSHRENVPLADVPEDFAGSFEDIPDLSDLHLEGAFLKGAHLEGAVLDGIHLEMAALDEAYLEGASLAEAHLELANLSEAHLEGAIFTEAHLEGAFFGSAHMEGASLGLAHMEGAFLWGAHLEGAYLTRAHLEGAILQLAFLDSSTFLREVVLGNEEIGYALLADVRWSDANLAVIDWTRVKSGFHGMRKRIEAIELGEERRARAVSHRLDGKPENKADRQEAYMDAVRANRQLATVLRSQGLNEAADGFAYKAQQLQREVLRRQGRYGAALGSWLLDVVAGYGYKPMRTLTAYLLAVISFAVAYFALGQTVGPHLSPLGAFVFSVTSFHGRGFFPGGIVLDDPITVLAAFEAFIGLVVEVSFIATFTQRFFAR
jgi:uncharacterized protein YjbI with pentapeptide repeats